MKIKISKDNCHLHSPDKWQLLQQWFQDNPQTSVEVEVLHWGLQTAYAHLQADITTTKRNQKKSDLDFRLSCPNDIKIQYDFIPARARDPACLPARDNWWSSCCDSVLPFVALDSTQPWWDLTQSHLLGKRWKEFHAHLYIVTFILELQLHCFFVAFACLLFICFCMNIRMKL